MNGAGAGARTCRCHFTVSRRGILSHCICLPDLEDDDPGQWGGCSASQGQQNTSARSKGVLLGGVKPGAGRHAPRSASHKVSCWIESPRVDPPAVTKPGRCPFPDTGFFYTPPSRASSGGWNHASTAGRQGPLAPGLPFCPEGRVQRNYDYGAIEPQAYPSPPSSPRRRGDGSSTQDAHAGPALMHPPHRFPTALSELDGPRRVRHTRGAEGRKGGGEPPGL